MIDWQEMRNWIGVGASVVLVAAGVIALSRGSAWFGVILAILGIAGTVLMTVLSRSR